MIELAINDNPNISVPITNIDPESKVDAGEENKVQDVTSQVT